MMEAELKDDEISLFALATTLLRSRWRIVRWMLIGAVVAVLPVISTPLTYSASASFIPQGYDAGNSGLASLAGQFGVSLPSSNNQSLSPEFYSELMRSRVLLLPISHDTLRVQEMGGKRIPFFDLFDIRGTPEQREEEAVAMLRGIASVSVDKTTGVVEVSATTQWRSVSLVIVTALINGINDYNESIRQGQATAERKFVESRLNIASAELRAAEERLKSFLRNNREIGSSAELIIDRERIQRDLTLRQQVFTSLTQAYEEARIREVRDTPVITVFEQPWVPTLPGARGRLKRALLGVVLGGFFAVLMILISATMSRRKKEGDAEFCEFLATLREIKEEMLERVRWLGGRMQPQPPKANR